MDILEGTDNILAPLTFTEGEIDVFIRDHVCACGSHLVKYPANGRAWTAYCPACDLPIIASGYMHKAQAEKAEQNVLEGARLLRDTPQRSTAQALSELGF